MAALVARFGAVATAAYGIGIRMMSVSWTVSGAVGQATATGVGQNLGARTPERAVAVTRVATVVTMAILAAFAAVLLSVPEGAMRVFIDDPAVVAAGVELLWVSAPFWAFFGGLMVIQGAFRGAGDTRTAMVLSLLSRWVFRIPVAVLLAFVLGWGAIGVWWGLSVAALASFVVGVAWFARGTWTEGVIDDGRPDRRTGADDGEDLEAESLSGDD